MRKRITIKRKGKKEGKVKKYVYDIEWTQVEYDGWERLMATWLCEGYYDLAGSVRRLKDIQRHRWRTYELKREIVYFYECVFAVTRRFVREWPSLNEEILEETMLKIVRGMELPSRSLGRRNNGVNIRSSKAIYSTGGSVEAFRQHIRVL